MKMEHFNWQVMILMYIMMTQKKIPEIYKKRNVLVAQLFTVTDVISYLHKKN
jgi:hypothetical protein